MQKHPTYKSVEADEVDETPARGGNLCPKREEGIHLGFVFIDTQCVQVTSETCTIGKISWCNHQADKARKEAERVVQALIASGSLESEAMKSVGNGCLITDSC